MSQKKTNSGKDPYLSLIGKIFRTEKVQFGTKYEAWEGEVLRVNYAEGLATIITGLPEEAQKVINLRYGLSGAGPHTVKQTGKELKLPASRVKAVERATLYELSQTHCRYFYTCSPYARDDSKMFRKTLKYLKGSGFSTFIMYILADVQICNRERLQGFVHLCPEFFSIFSNEGCEQLVKMGCEDPRDQKVLSNYLFDDFTRVEMLGFSPRTYEMLVFGNGIYTVGLLKMLDIDAICGLHGVTETEITEICDKLVRIGCEDPRPSATRDKGANTEPTVPLPEEITHAYTDEMTDAL